MNYRTSKGFGPPKDGRAVLALRLRCCRCGAVCHGSADHAGSMLYARRLGWRPTTSGWICKRHGNST